MALPGGWQHLLAGCDPVQVEAITSPAAPLLVVAGAGSGKTRVLTRRIAWRIAQEQAVAGRVLALTFTRKAAGELRGRLAALGLPAPVTAGTFHAVALAQLRRRALEQGRQPPAVLDAKGRLLGRLLAGGAGSAGGAGGAGGATGRRGGRRPPPAAPPARHELLSVLAGEIEWAKARCIAPDGYPAAATAAGRAVPLGVDEIADHYATYELERRRRGLLDFDDLLWELVRALETDAAFAAAQRWQFAHLFVDELQDATTLQLRLVDAWLGGRADLFAVGDPRQSVYAFNGADPEAITGFARRHPGATVLELATNYRSSPQVVSVASAALGAPGDQRLARSGRPDGQPPEVRACPDERSEALAVAHFLRRARPPGRAWSSCAVLARTNAQLERLAEALTDAGIPVVRAGAGVLADHPAVQATLEDLPAALAGNRLLSLVAERVEEVGLRLAPPGSWAVVPDDAAALRALASLAEEYVALDPAPSAVAFRAFVRASAADGLDARGRDGVELVTFHRAKGLEWEVVCVTGLEHGFVPIAHARDDDALAEERRLLYVALTRATDRLHCSWAAERTFGGRRVRRDPSPWLPALERACRHLGELPARATVAAALAESRAALAAPEQPGAAHEPLPRPKP